MGLFRALAMTLMLAPALALARPAKPTTQQLQQAGELVKKAIAASQAGDHDAAIELYQQAYDIVPNAMLLSNIGSEYQLVAKPVEAIKYFCKYIDADPTGSNVSYASAQVKTLQTNLGNPVDEDNVCKAAAPAPSKPSDTIDATTTHQPHAVRDDDSRDHAEADTGKRGHGLEIAGVSIGVIGAASVVVGVVYALKAKSLSDKIDQHDPTQPWPTTLDGVPIASWDHQGDQWNKRAYMFSIGGGVAVLAGATLFVVGHSRSSSAERVSVVPTASTHGGGIALSGRF